LRAQLTVVVRVGPSSIAVDAAALLFLNEVAERLRIVRWEKRQERAVRRETPAAVRSFLGAPVR
jgi:hypothetical protein